MARLVTSLRHWATATIVIRQNIAMLKQSVETLQRTLGDKMSHNVQQLARSVLP
jgi:hypothetical protein